MKDIDRERIHELTIDEWIWVIFIVLSFLNIFGDEIEKHFATYHEKKDKEISRKIFNFTVFSSFLIYIYLLSFRYKKYKELKMKHENVTLAGIRCIASIFVVIAAALFLYAQLTDSKPVNPSIQ